MPASEHDFDAFVAARTPALSRTAYLLTGDAHLAEDLVQTALFKAARAWDRIQGHPERYVRRILYTQNVSWWRSRRQVRETALQEYDGPAAAADTDLRLSLEQALARLTTRQRTVLVLRSFEELTEGQTADVLGIGAGTVKSITRRALGRLRVGPTEPGWPWSDERKAVMIGLGVVASLALLYGARRIGRRRPLR